MRLIHSSTQNLFTTHLITFNIWTPTKKIIESHKRRESLLHTHKHARFLTQRIRSHQMKKSKHQLINPPQGDPPGSQPVLAFSQPSTANMASEHSSNHVNGSKEQQTSPASRHAPVTRRRWQRPSRWHQSWEHYQWGKPRKFVDEIERSYTIMGENNRQNILPVRKASRCRWSAVDRLQNTPVQSESEMSMDSRKEQKRRLQLLSWARMQWEWRRKRKR